MIQYMYLNPTLILHVVMVYPFHSLNMTHSSEGIEAELVLVLLGTGNGSLSIQG